MRTSSAAFIKYCCRDEPVRTREWFRHKTRRFLFLPFRLKRALFHTASFFLFFAVSSIYTFLTHTATSTLWPWKRPKHNTQRTQITPASWRRPLLHLTRCLFLFVFFFFFLMHFSQILSVCWSVASFRLRSTLEWQRNKTQWKMSGGQTYSTLGSTLSYSVGHNKKQ